MPVDKFGRRDDRKTQERTLQETSSLTELNDTFLRRDGTNTAIGTIDMTGNTFTNVSNPENDHDAVNKVYVDENAGISKNGDTMQGELNMNNFRLTGLPSALPGTGDDAVSWSQAVQLVRDSERDFDSKVSTTGDTMTGDLIISADGDNDRVLGCTDIMENRRFAIPLETNSNRLYYVFRRQPVVLETDHGFLVKAKNELVCQLGSSYDPVEITVHKNVRMNSNRITNLPEPSLPHEVANKLYVDTKPRKILQGYIPQLRSRSATYPNDEFGFVVTASSNINNFYQPVSAFNGLYSNDRGVSGEWASHGEHRNLWIQITCPDLVRL